MACVINCPGLTRSYCTIIPSLIATELHRTLHLTLYPPALRLLFNMAPPLNPLPSLGQLPLRKGDPPNSAWGLWGDGPDSALGALNYLIEERVSRAVREEIQTGQRVGLKCVSPAASSGMFHQC